MFKKLRLMIFFSVVIMLVSQGLVFSQDDVTVTWWVETTDQGELDHLQLTLVEPFEEANPGINLEITGQEGLQDVLRTTILGGEAPDILHTFGPSWNAEYIDAGFMLSLDTYADLYGWQDKILPWALAYKAVEMNMVLLASQCWHKVSK